MQLSTANETPALKVESALRQLKRALKFSHLFLTGWWFCCPKTKVKNHIHALKY